MKISTERDQFHTYNAQSLSLGKGGGREGVNRCHKINKCFVYFLYGYYFVHIKYTQWTRGPWATSLTWETSFQINKHICSELWLYHNVDLERKRERERQREWMLVFCLSIMHYFFSRNSENKQVVDTALIIACLYVKFIQTKFMFLI